VLYARALITDTCSAHDRHRCDNRDVFYLEVYVRIRFIFFVLIKFFLTEFATAEKAYHGENANLMITKLAKRSVDKQNMYTSIELGR
jgi:hypothetical protein